MKRKYYSLEEAERISKFSKADLIHTAANQRLPLYALLPGVEANELIEDETGDYFTLGDETSLIGPYLLPKRSIRIAEAGGNPLIDSVYRDGFPPIFYQLAESLPFDRFNLVVMAKDLEALESTDTSTSQQTYSTVWISVLNAAIAEFFEPRHDRDAKKEEVVEWVMNKAAEAGEVRSANVAEAIFTIIKPKDHQPRKRKGISP